MGKVNNALITLAACAMTVVGCVNEKIENNPNHLTGETVKVQVALGLNTKGFSDQSGLVWEVGDQIKYAGGINLTSAPLTAQDITQNGHHAEFSFDAALINTDRTGWFVSTKCHPGNDTEVEYTLGKSEGWSLLQERAGQMNNRYVFLHSGTGLINIVKDQAPVVNMDIAGSIFRIIPYTSKYNDEKIVSVTFESNDFVVGTVAYDRGAGTYRGVNDINWQKSQKLCVNLKSPFSLTGVTSMDTSNGIYMAVAATKTGSPLNGYKFVVETDKAKYIFDAMNKPLEVKENIVKNYPLNLDKAIRQTEAGGELRYTGDLNFLNGKKLPASGVEKMDAGYWFAQVKIAGSADWVTREGADNEFFYSGVTFKVTDPNTGAPVDWLNVSYPGGGGTHWFVSAKPNTGEARQAKITATFPDVKGYVVIPEAKTKEIIISQSDANAKKIVDYASVSVPADKTFSGNAQNMQNVGYCLLKVDGVDNRDWSAQGIYARSRFVAVTEADYLAKNYTSNSAADWLSCVYANNGNDITDCVWLVSATENNSGAERVGYIVCLFPDDASYQFPEPKALKVIQNVKTESKPLPAGSYSYDLQLVTTGGVGMAPNTVGQGNYAFIRNPKVDGKPVVLDDSSAEQILQKAFKSVVPTADEIAKFGMQAKKPSADAVKARVRWYGGAQIDVALQSAAAGSITKIVALNPDGSEFGSFIVWTD